MAREMDLSVKDRWRHGVTASCPYCKAEGRVTVSEAVTGGEAGEWAAIAHEMECPACGGAWTYRATYAFELGDVEGR